MPLQHPKAHVTFSSVKQQESRKIPLTFSSLAFLVFLSLFLYYLFLLVYLIMELTLERKTKREPSLDLALCD